MVKGHEKGEVNLLLKSIQPFGTEPWRWRQKLIFQLCQDLLAALVGLPGWLHIVAGPIRFFR